VYFIFLLFIYLFIYFLQKDTVQPNLKLYIDWNVEVEGAECLTL